ncbi:MAG: ubiquitin-activating E1 FCCH domain-containing protein [Nanoarchaeota archaeon]|nr:ubiquitin-activating E1 FCCH domain-containing protein [Nanoarchaeota archaeon]
MGFSTKGVQNWAGGEASPSLRGRSDVSQYDAVAETVENLLVTHYGSVLKTPGTKYVARTKDMSKATRLIPFIFSTGDSYMLEFGHNYIRIFQGGGSIVETAVNISGATKADPCVVTTATAHGYSNGDAVDIESVGGMTELNNKRYLVASVTSNTFELQDEDGVDIDSSGYTTYTSSGTTEKIHEITTTYASTDLDDLKFAQQADVMYITHQDYPLKKLSRFASTTWTFANITYDDVDFPPFLSINTSATTITPSGTTGAITLTASTAIFDADHVGAYYRVHIGTKPDGYALVTGYIDSTHVYATVKSTLGGTSATDNWYEGAWSAYQGYPSDVKFYEQRLYCSATTKKPLTVWGSVPGAYDDFWIPASGETTADDDGLSFTIGSNQVDRILWMYPTSTLDLGTAGGPFTFSSGSSTSPVTPTNVNAKQGNEDGASSVSPVRIGSFLYYVERSGKILGELAYSLDYDVFETDDMTYLSDHILGNGVSDMALQRYPYNILWCVRTDGVISTLTRQAKNQIKGWSRQVFGGTDTEAENVGVIPNGVEDQVWLIIKRTINGSTTRYIEYVMPHDFGDQQDAFFIQSGLTYDEAVTITDVSVAASGGTITVTAAGHGFSNDDKVRIVDVGGMTELNDNYYYVANSTSTTFELVDSDGDDIVGTSYTTYTSGGEVRKCVTTISGFDHLEGETLKVLADGAVLPDVTVSSGSITISYSSAIVHAGIGYTSTLKTMDLNSGSVSGSSQDKVTQISKVFVRFNESLGCTVGNGTVMDTIVFRKWGDSMDQAPSLFTGDKEVMFPSEHVKNKYIYVEQTQPLPLHVLGLFPRMLVSE